MSSGHSFRSFTESRECGRMQTRINLYINASNLLNGWAQMKTHVRQTRQIAQRNQLWCKKSCVEKIIVLKCVCTRAKISCQVMYSLFTRKDKHKCHLYFLAPHFCKLAHISLLFDSCKSGTQANDYCIDISYLCTNLGRTEFMHLLNGLNSKQLSSYTLLFPLEILKFYHPMSLMTPAIVVINSCCICCWRSDFIFV